MMWFLCYGTGWAQGNWVTAPPGHSELPRRPKNQAIWERYKLFMLPCSVLPLFCAVPRSVCEACVQADRLSYPPGPTALPKVYQPHPVAVPCVGLSKCCPFTHTSPEQLISNVMHTLLWLITSCLMLCHWQFLKREWITLKNIRKENPPWRRISKVTSQLAVGSPSLTESLASPLGRGRQPAF